MLLDELVDLVKSSAQELGKEVDIEAVRKAAQEQARLLAKAIGEPGYRRALKSARNIVAMAGGIDIVEAADAADAKLSGVIEGALGITARILGGLA